MQGEKEKAKTQLTVIDILGFIQLHLQEVTLEKIAKKYRRNRNDDIHWLVHSALH